MIERIIAGILIGLIAGYLLNKKQDDAGKATNIVIGFIALVIIAFVASSFMFGAIYGGMAIGEIALGYWLAGNICKRTSAICQTPDDPNIPRTRETR